MITQIATPESWVEWLTRYLARETAGSRPATTRNLRSYHLRRFAHSAERAPADVTSDDIQDHINNPDWSPGYRRSVLGSLRSFYRWARRAGLIVLDPAEDAPSITVPLTKPRPASDEAIEAGNGASDPRVPLMIRLGNEAGMRCCEIAQVHSRDVIGRPGQYLLLVHGKGGRDRTVPLSDELARILLDFGGYVFAGRINGHLSSSYVSKLISRAMGHLGTGHQLRHRAGTDWLEASGGNLRVAQELLGHASVATTQIYTLINDDQLRNAVQSRKAA